jgi:hypothetical protein
MLLLIGRTSVVIRRLNVGMPIDPHSGATNDPQKVVASDPQKGVTGAPQKGVTITKKSILRNQTKSNDSLYRQVVECFSKGFEKLESSKLSWVGKEKAYGNAVNIIIKQAKSINQEWSETEVWQEIRARAALLLKHIEREKSLARRGLKHDEYIAKLKFVPAVHYVCKAPRAGMLLLITRTSVVIRRLNAALIPRLPLNK